MSDRIQFCRGDYDITADIYAEDDADEVRVWRDDDVLLAVSRDSSGSWSYAASDLGPSPDWDQDLDRIFPSWQDALSAFGVAH
jgi:hypothetical protein